LRIHPVVRADQLGARVIVSIDLGPAVLDYVIDADDSWLGLGFVERVAFTVPEPPAPAEGAEEGRACAGGGVALCAACGLPTFAPIDLGANGVWCPSCLERLTAQGL
jgi:hypothetical protein